MKKLTSLLIGFLIMISTSIHADEGMWLLTMLNKMNMDRMHEMGLKLTAEDIYSVNQSSVKDAVVNFGGFCTGEIVSDKGLIFTNHHCGYGAIQEHSTTEHNYLKDGFWAKDFEEEIPIEGLYVAFLERMEDVSDQINNELTEDMSEQERAAKIRQLSSKIEDEATKDNNLEARVKSFYAGNEFYLMVYEKFTDVRLVGAPPESIGKFGHDTDNWMWPRHTGDFSIFRVYADENGNPADYSEDNVPLKPDHHFPISLKGVEDGDFSMILGFPGGTDRYMTSWGVKEAMKITNPIRIQVRDKKQEIMMEAMNSSEELRIMYSSKYSRSSNYYKYSIGQNEGLRKLDVVEEKQKIEKKFREWVSQKEARQEKYGGILDTIKSAYKEREGAYRDYMYMIETMFQGPEIVQFSSRFFGLYRTLKMTPDSTKAIQAEVDKLKEGLDDFYKDYHKPTDKKIFAALFEIFHKEVDEQNQPQIFTTIENEYNGSMERYADFLYNNSIFPSKSKVMEFLNNPEVKVLENDPAFHLLQSIQTTVRGLGMEYRSYAQKLGKGKRVFLEGLIKMQEDRDFYPDANFTMRLTYGKVDDYYPRDAVHYDYYTTLQGVMEKEDPDDMEFVVSEKLKELYRKKDYGRYGEDGEMRVCFISNNDITGGNSGSPVLNGNGELIGIAFDGNWEAMSGDIKFEPDLQRTISVDVRYVLFVIDKYANADRLIEEMDIVE
jgi:hypothetical protein